MKVYLGYHCYDTGADVVRIVSKVFDDEVKALLWAEDKEFARNADTHRDQPIEWREYVEMEME